MEDNSNQKMIMMSLGSMLIGSLLFIFGISIVDNLVLLLCEYIIAMLLFLSALIALKNYVKKNNQPIYKYLIILDLVLVFIATYALISKL